MTSRWKKVWADFWGNKSRTFLTIVIIAVGAFAVGATNNLRLYMSESLNSDFLSAKPSEATINTSLLDDDMVEIARNVPGVDAVEGRSILVANVIHTDGRTIAIQFTALKDPNTLTLNLLKPIKGETTLPPLNDKQMLVDSAVARLGYKPGDTITIKLVNGRHRHIKLAGYIHDITSPPYGGAWGSTIYAYVTPETMEWLGGSRSYNILAVSVAENQTDQTHVTEVAQAISDRMEEAGVTVDSLIVRNPGRHFSWDIIQAVFFLIIALGYMMVFLSGFLIVNSITALMAGHTRQIGIMKSLGGRTSQILGMYVALILPIYNSVRVTIREALTNYGIGTDIKPRDKSVSRIELLIPRPIRLSVRNAFRRKARLLLTMFALVLGGSIFIGVYNLWGAFDKLFNDLQGYFLSDVTVTFDRYHRFDKVSPIALDVPGVSRVEGWLIYSGTLAANDEEEGTQVILFAPPSTSTIIVPVIASGRWLAPGDDNAIVVSNHFVNTYPDTKVGDWLTIRIDDKKTKWNVVGIYTISIDTGFVYVNYEYLSHITGRPNQVYSLQVLTDQHNAATQSRIADELRALYETHGIQVSKTETATETMAGAQGITIVVIYFMGVMAVLIAIVGGLD
jgi:ABC-type lipoprotein release transport system permease subunit